LNCRIGTYGFDRLVIDLISGEIPDGRAFLIGYNAYRGTLTGEWTMMLDIWFIPGCLALTGQQSTHAFRP